tara:strand:+ start:330 stop:1055 length:726 start_codon:yes stop_codon:yes gene_type:complete
MNTIIIKNSELLEPDLYQIQNKEIVNHIQKVLKLKVGEALKVCLVNEGIGTGIIKSLSSAEAIIFLKKKNVLKKRNPWVNLIIGLSRPQTCKKVLELGTSMGVKSFEFLDAKLSEKSYAQSKVFQNNAFEKYLLNGLSQSSNLHIMPSLKVEKSLKKESGEEGEQKLILSPFSEKSLNDISLDFEKPITVAIGPERGWTGKEVEKFKSHNFLEVKISSSVLRVETATISVLSQLELLKNKI